jgi:hypothetical protein
MAARAAMAVSAKALPLIYRGKLQPFAKKEQGRKHVADHLESGGGMRSALFARVFGQRDRQATI